VQCEARGHGGARANRARVPTGRVVCRIRQRYAPLPWRATPGAQCRSFCLFGRSPCSEQPVCSR
jgi:hypothetical protein